MLMGNAKPTKEELERLRAEKGKGRVWVYQNTQVGTPDAGKLLYLAKPYAPPGQIADPVDGTLWRNILVGYIPDLKTGEIWECSMGPREPQDPRLTRKMIPGAWGKEQSSTPRESTAPPEGREVDGAVSIGTLPPDHPIFSAGPFVAGRPIFQPRPPYTAEDAARNFKIVREHLVKTGWKPGYVYVAGKWEPPGEKEGGSYQ